MNVRRPFHPLRLMLIVSFFLIPTDSPRAVQRTAVYAPQPVSMGAVVTGVSMSWNTFLGGPDHDTGYKIAADESGNVYIAGESSASWGTPLNPFVGESDLFVSKLDNQGGLVWNTFLGAGDTNEYYPESGPGIAIDGSGNVYVTGTSFASWGTPLNPFAGVEDAFVARLDSNGNLLWNTFLGSEDMDGSHDIAVDESGNIYITGSSADWGSPLNPFAGDEDAFVARLDSNGNLLWNTFLGGLYSDTGYGIFVGGSGDVYVTGVSDADWGTPVSPYVGWPDAFAARLDSSGNRIWNTFLLGDDSHSDGGYGTGIAVDEDGGVYIIGSRSIYSYEPLHENHDGFMIRLDSNGAFAWRIFLGLSDYPPNEDFGYAVAVDRAGDIYASGMSSGSWGMPVRKFSGDTDAFVAKVDSSGNVIWNTFLGGPGEDSGNGLAVGGGGDIYVVGVSREEGNWGMPVRPRSGPSDAFVAKLSAVQRFPSASALDGWVLESTETSDRGGRGDARVDHFILGDDAANRQYRSILSFNTGNLPDYAVITKITLKVKSHGVVGGDPVKIFQGFMVDVKMGFFSSAPGLQASDFQAKASKSYGPFKPELKNGWYTINLTTAKNYINELTSSGGVTQIRLRFKLDDNNNTDANYLSLYSGNAPAASRPQLVIEYYVP